MRLIIFGFIAAVAGFMAWQWVQPVCRGGQLAVDEQTCARMAGFDAGFCRRVFTRTDEVARRSGTSYPSLHECNQAWPKCLERGAAGEAVPVPSSWCIVRGADGALARLAPQYDNYRQ